MKTQKPIDDEPAPILHEDSEGVVIVLSWSRTQVNAPVKRVVDHHQLFN